MLDRFLNYFRSPEDANPSFIRLTRNILIFTIITTAGILLLITGIVPGTSKNLNSIAGLGIAILLEIISLVLAVRGKVAMAKIIVPIALLFAVTFIAISSNGLHDVSMVGFPAVLVVGALLLGKRASTTVTPLVVIGVEVVALADLTGFNRSVIAAQTGVDDAAIAGILMLAISAFLQLLINRLNENIDRALKNERAQIEANRELKTLQAELEKRVDERTLELAVANLRNERRAKQFEAVAQVARAATSIQDEQTLLPRIAELVSEQFGFYHTGVFLLDHAREYAILRAANSEGGKKMLARGHSLKVGQVGIVGFVAATGNPRVALDVGADAVFFDNPDLPHTRSELGLPLKIGGQVIGVLDVQSVESNAFNQDDVNILLTLADQVSVAIQNARSFEQTQKLLAEAQRAVGGSIQETWRVMQSTERRIGYQLSKNSVIPLKKPVHSNHIKQAIESGETVKISGKTASITVPIRLRGEVIGVMDVHIPDEHTWDPDEVDIAEAVAERLSLAIETATLLQSTQHHAQIERITSEISGKISSTTQFEAILRTAAEELSRVLGGSEVLVQIQPEALEDLTEA